VQPIAIGWHDDPGTLPLLHAAATDPSETVRQAAVQAITEDH
jgi:HEAT repeat protein